MKGPFLFEPAYFPLPAAAHYSGLGPFTLRRLVNTGALPHIRVAGRILIEKSVLDAFLKDHQQVGPCVSSHHAPTADVLASVGAFLAEQCVVAPGRSSAAGDLYAAYCGWAARWGVSEREMLKVRSLGLALAALGLEKDKGAAGKRLWRGVGLRSV